jgi:hypothetical protein
MVAGSETVGGWLHNPLNVEPKEIKKFPPHHGNFTRVDPIRTIDRASATFGALEEIVKPFLEDNLGKVPGACKSSKEFAAHCEISPVN